MQRYFVKDKINDNFILVDTDIHHIKNVMRYKVNDQIEIVYKEKVHVCNIDSLEPLRLTTISILEENKKINVNLTVAISLVQEQKFDLILQKLTELGVNEIVPVKTERSIVKIDKLKEEKKLIRWNNICKEASEQSKRTTTPKIDNIITLKELINNKKQLNLICSLSNDTKPLNCYLNQEINNILFIIGPEGGFSTQEEKFLIENGFKPTTLGKRVLRVETAAIYVASIINYIYGG